MPDWIVCGIAAVAAALQLGAAAAPAQRDCRCALDGMNRAVSLEIQRMRQDLDRATRLDRPEAGILLEEL